MLQPSSSRSLANRLSSQMAVASNPALVRGENPKSRVRDADGLLGKESPWAFPESLWEHPLLKIRKTENSQVICLHNPDIREIVSNFEVVCQLHFEKRSDTLRENGIGTDT